MFPTVINLEREAALGALVAALQQRFGSALAGVLLYGSCLRSGDYFDGLVDFYVVVDSYGAAYGRGVMAVANWLLPPNVFYLDVAVADRHARCKYAVLSRQQLRHCVSSGRLESYFWGRFSQPVAVVFSRGAGEFAELAGALRQARATFLEQVLPAIPAEGTVMGLWQAGLALSYGTELRTEQASRPVQLVAANQPFYEACAREWSADNPGKLALTRRDETLCFTSHYDDARRRRSQWGWALRRVMGKLASLARLIKGLFTFDGGIDYVVWKLERHSGQRIDIPERVRRWPLLFLWGFCWRLYRRGLFR